jgi:polygalacturonase
MASAMAPKLVWSPVFALLVMSVSCVSSAAEPDGTSVVFNIDSYGARGDGKHDDTPAVAKAWNAACSSSRPVVLVVPKGKSYMLKSVALSGPCKSTVVFMLKGTLVAPPSRSDWSEDSIRC